MKRNIKLGDSINVGGYLGPCTLYSIESFHTIVVVKDGKYYRVSGLSLCLNGRK